MLVEPAISVVPGPHDRVAVPAVNIAREDSDESNADIESDTLSVHEHADVQEELPHESDSVELGSVISGADEEVDEVEVEEVEDVAATRFAPAVVREAFRSLDDVNLVHEFSRKAFVMQNITTVHQMPLPQRVAQALEEMTVRGDAVRRERGWKFFLLLPRLLLFRPARGGLISKKKLEERFADFVR